MSSGNKEIVINNQERAVSLDINRLQAFFGTHIAQMMRFFIDATANEDDAAGVATVGAAVTAPMRGEIFNGLLVKPEVGGTNIFVDPGVAVLVSPDASPSADDIALKVIVDPGVTQTGQLTLASNTSGQTRIDVVECAVNPDTLLEVDNRDIFNNGTGLFTATSVDKVTQSVLRYRVRQGTPGAGYPAAQTGWLPLTVCRVPNAFATLNDCDFWDVRPLLSDRVHNPMNVSDSGYPFNVTRSVQVVQPAGATSYLPWDRPIQLTGRAEAVLGARRVGGRFAPSGGYVDLNDVSALDPTTSTDFSTSPTYTTSGITIYPFYAWLATFFGLPRWARYTPFSAGVRKPMSPRGVVIFSAKAPGFDGTPIAALTAPAWMGLGAATTSSAKLIAAFPFQGLREASFQLGDTRVEEAGSVHRFTDPAGIGATTLNNNPFSNAMLLETSTAIDPGTHKQWVKGVFTLTDNITHPMSANVLHVRLYPNGLQVNGSGTANDVSFRAEMSLGGTDYWWTRKGVQALLPTSGGYILPELEFDIYLLPATSNTPRVFTLTLTYIANQASPASDSFQYQVGPPFSTFGAIDILGWDLRN